MYLMNWRSQIVLFDKESCRYSSIEVEDLDLARAARLSLDCPSPDFIDRFIFGQDSKTSIRCTLSGCSRTLLLVWDPVERRYHLQDDQNFYFCYDTEQYGFSRHQAELWESFLLFSDEQIKRLQYILSNSWVATSTTEIIDRKDVNLHDAFELRLGRFSLDLRAQSLDLSDDYKFVGFHAYWKLERFQLFRPLVYTTAFSSPIILEQLSLCLTSLQELGEFTGRIVVLTDLSHEEVCALCPNLSPHRIKIFSLRPVDFVGYVCSKYSILDNADFRHHQPLLFVDPDIIFDLPVAPMLAAAAASRRVCAPLEDWNRLRAHSPIGATLLQLDNIEPRFASGFNGGTLSMPNVDDPLAREFFDLVRAVIANTGYAFGREFNAFADQEVANYVAWKAGDIDTVTLTPFVNHSIPRRPYANHRRGIFHFWGYEAAEKVRQMTSYLAELRSHSPEK